MHTRMIDTTIHTSIAWDDMIREVIMILGNHSYSCCMGDFDRDKTCIYCMRIHAVRVIHYTV